MSSANDIAARLGEIRTRMESSAKRACRRAGEISLIAVTKTVPAERIFAAAAAGQRIFGENYVQEASIKAAAFSKSGDPPSFHLIGHLQRNKSKDAVRLFDLIHTIDSERTAAEVSKEAAKIGKVQSILVQVNISEEDSKYGVPAAEAEALVGALTRIPAIKVLGLMSIGRFVPVDSPEDERRSDFRKLAALRGEIEKHLDIALPHLSMGMSHDFELAIEEEATFVRVGTAIFGERVKG